MIDKFRNNNLLKLKNEQYNFYAHLYNFIFCKLKIFFYLWIKLLTMIRLCLFLLLTLTTSYAQRKENINTHKEWDDLLKKYVSEKGLVDYNGFRQDADLLANYLKTTSASKPDKTWSKNVTLAYWMNLYNAYTVQLIILNYPVKSIKDISNPWSKKFFTIAGESFNLEKIEHSILRKMGDSRIHFGINCASFSCPNLYPIAFTEYNVNELLTLFATRFINDSSKNKLSTEKIELSEIFKWFKKDFVSETHSLIDYINMYSNTLIKSNAKISYINYDWRLNE